MKVQIYEIQNPRDARMCVERGVNFIGVVVGEQGIHEAERSFEECREIYEVVPPSVMKTAIPMVSGVNAILEIIRAVKPDVLHLSGCIGEFAPEQIADIKRAEPLIRIMQAIPVGGPETRERALKYTMCYQDVSDYFILDTVEADSDYIGATGEIHDWSISAAIVRLVNIPVILAGGLGPNNVAEAIHAVHPFGVDSYTRTNVPGTRRKDPEKVAAFVSEARAALR